MEEERAHAYEARNGDYRERGCCFFLDVDLALCEVVEEGEDLFELLIFWYIVNERRDDERRTEVIDTHAGRRSRGSEDAPER